jgi:hypothetical protein
VFNLGNRSAFALGVAAIASSTITANAQEASGEAGAERDLHLSCESLTENVVDILIAIDAERARARARPRNARRPQPTYGVAYTPTHIRLYPNRQAPNPPPVHFEIDRADLSLVLFKRTFPDTGERNVVGRAQCTQSEPDPELAR